VVSQTRRRWRDQHVADGAADRRHRALAAALYKLAGDADLRHRMGEEGRLRAPDYSWDRVTERIVAYYHEVRDRVLAA
jgi:glycosyltransferase involved in cell wall biosynthesis